jgi:uncharacterized protein YjbI with pentapeptide repeats
MPNLLSNLPNWAKISLLILLSALAVILGIDNLNYLTSQNNSDELSQVDSDELMEVDFIVQTEKNKPIEGAKIQFIFDGAPEPRWTDSNGYVRVEIPQRDDIDIVITKDKFKTRSQTVNLEADSNRTRVYQLESEISASRDEETTTISPSTEETVISEETAPGTQESDEVAETKQQLLTTRSCFQCDLSGANLENKDLTDVFLQRGVLKDANLVRANLQDADLLGAQFHGASLKEANLSNATLYDTVFIRADLTNADLRGANLKRADFSNSILRDADLSGAQIDEKTQLGSADLCGAIMPNGSVFMDSCQ